MDYVGQLVGDGWMTASFGESLGSRESGPSVCPSGRACIDPCSRSVTCHLYSWTLEVDVSKQ